MIEIDKIAENLFDKIRTRFPAIRIGDENAKSTRDPSKARFFNFDFTIDGESFGNITISLVDSQNLKIYFDKEIDQKMPDEVKNQWYAFLKNIRFFAKSNLLSFDVRDIAKPRLGIDDLKHANKNADVIDKDDIEINESKMYGTSRSSYQKMESVRIIARHSKQVDEEQRGARSRNINAIYIENQLGERFRLPEGTTLPTARVYARHIKNGGQLNDDFGQHIGKIIKEMADLKLFVRNMRGRVFEDAETNGMVQAAIDHYGSLHSDLFSLRGQKGYEQYRALWQPELNEDEEFDLDELKERFVKRVFDDRMMDALPVVHRAYNKQKNLIGEEFESWANEMTSDIDGDEDEGPFANSLDGNAIDDDDENDAISELLQNNQFEFSFMDGTYWFESGEELERAKDIMAAEDPHMKWPSMGVQDPTKGTEAVYGSSTFDRESGSHGVMETTDELSLFKSLAGIK